MNRFKFRVWDKLENRFIYPDKGYQGHYILTLNGEFYNLQNGSGGKECVVQQFTGIYDKQNNEIYEGDLLETKGQMIGSYFLQGNDILPAHPNNTFYTWLCKVFWDDGYACYLLEYIDHPKYIGRGSFKDEMIGVAPWAKVVGNIFENPELLTN